MLFCSRRIAISGAWGGIWRSLESNNTQEGDYLLLRMMVIIIVLTKRYVVVNDAHACERAIARMGKM